MSMYVTMNTCVSEFILCSRIFIELSGGNVSSETVDSYIQLISSARLYISLDEVEEGELHLELIMGRPNEFNH